MNLSPKKEVKERRQEGKERERDRGGREEEGVGTALSSFKSIILEAPNTYNHCNSRH